ncbi:MAG: hypothetical protein LUG96_09745 [Tannerellaceae bacterium]|nr:hypothetical protein [Tannerellaceae bacterium]
MTNRGMHIPRHTHNYTNRSPEGGQKWIQPFTSYEAQETENLIPATGYTSRG